MVDTFFAPTTAGATDAGTTVFVGSDGQSFTIDDLANISVEDIAENTGYSAIPSGIYSVYVDAESIPAWGEFTKVDDSGEETKIPSGVFKAKITRVWDVDATVKAQPGFKTDSLLNRVYVETERFWENPKSRAQEWAGRMKHIALVCGFAAGTSTVTELFQAFAGKEFVVKILTTPDRKRPGRTNSRLQYKEVATSEAMEQAFAAYQASQGKPAA